MTLTEAYEQGLRCGYIEGRARGDLGEPLIKLSHEAAGNQNLDDEDLTREWARGYRSGYVARSLEA